MPLHCKLSLAGEVADRLRRSPKGKLREWSEREEIDEGFLCPAQFDGPGTLPGLDFGEVALQGDHEFTKSSVSRETILGRDRSGR